MGDSQGPPRPPLSPTRSITPMLYYGLLVVGMAAVVLALYHFVIVRWCPYFSDPRSGQRFHPLHKVSFGSSIKYKRDDGADEDSECAVCLSVFEEGEEIRKLPKCNHSFHAPCIDMWLYSHMDCPLCRSAVELPGVQRRPAAVEQPEHSREELPFPVGLF